LSPIYRWVRDGPRDPSWTGFSFAGRDTDPAVAPAATAASRDRAAAKRPDPASTSREELEARMLGTARAGGGQGIRSRGPPALRRLQAQKTQPTKEVARLVRNGSPEPALRNGGTAVGILVPGQQRPGTCHGR
jgi:hypothetical protein